MKPVRGSRPIEIHEYVRVVKRAYSIGNCHDPHSSPPNFGGRTESGNPALEVGPIDSDRVGRRERFGKASTRFQAASLDFRSEPMTNTGVVPLGIASPRI
jgi:hypothetical protein